MRTRKVDLHPVDSHTFIESLEKLAGRLDLIKLKTLTTNTATLVILIVHTGVLIPQYWRQSAVSRYHGRGKENLPGDCPLTLGTSTQAQHFKVDSQRHLTL